ncbi:glycosyltransferase family 4 protein [Flavobacterium beibuense]|uniref:Glycosyl transferase, group 1 n=1 Tax=Flavobacterium beibuense TaxID=657326 RepID=A0A444WIA5_9FLAO|nr:glycosyltransferase [Flavobacterium beibuense]RYJ45591.1 Glycosyl transferase, group 1 [Flavobacterium beibuense]
MKITIVTDHRFFRKGHSVYDDYVFNYDFFKTYLKVFDEIQVVARVKNVQSINPNWSVSNGDNVSFIDIPDIHGFKWLFFSSKYFKLKKAEILSTDCFCFRVPSHAAWIVYKLNSNKKAYMFESIGDPEDAMASSDDGMIKRSIFKIVGRLLKRRKQKITLHSNLGSYVSINHLQHKYPVKRDVLTESISSIRLDKSNFLTNPKQFGSKTIKIVHVGSFISLKNQKDLIQCVHKLSKVFDVRLDLIGDGILKNHCFTLAQQLNISEIVTFHGQVTGFNKIKAILDDSTFFVLPSSNEGMPRALIEAMARGLICFGSSVGGIAELLSKEFTFTPGNIDEMYSLIYNFIEKTPKADYLLISKENVKKVDRFELGILESKRIKLMKELKKITYEKS